MHPRHIRIAEYTYELPEEKIAKYPVADRDQSKLLIYAGGNITEDIYKNIGSYILPHSLVVFNNTKVVNARLLFPKTTGATIEVFCLEPDERYKDITNGMMQTREVFWKCLIGKAGKWSEKELSFVIPASNITLSATLLHKLNDGFIVRLKWDADITFAEVLHMAGAVPLPPYIKRKAEKNDNETYQTIYSKFEGSVAAPTAGLHFTPQVFEDFKNKNITWGFVALHVGAGTFKPVKAEQMEGHQMHAEWIDVPIEFIRKLHNQLKQNRPVVAVGTTAARTLESLYWLGVKAYQNPDLAVTNLTIHQWDAYELEDDTKVTEALTALIAYLEKNNLQKVITKTQLLIAPGYSWKIVKQLVTNFHQPNSTLLLLVAALIGDDWRKVYDYALANQFRFLSYGDGSILQLKA